MPEVRRRTMADRGGWATITVTPGVAAGGGDALIQARLAARAGGASISVKGSADHREIDAATTENAFDLTPFLENVDPTSRWNVTAYVKAAAAVDAAGALTIFCTQTDGDDDAVDAGWSGTVSGDHRLNMPSWNFLALLNPHIGAAWAGDPIDSLELHLRAVKF